MNDYKNEKAPAGLPWHPAVWRPLWEAFQAHRLPHALLLTGRPGLGKDYFARLFAQSILCAKPGATGFPCGDCHACQLVRAKSHPDLQIIVPEESHHVIKIEQTRGACHFIQQTSMLGGARIVIISPAHAMNTAAANALLKTLEEPTPHTLFMLISEQRLKLPATIMSRCQTLSFKAPQKAMAAAWINQQREHPLPEDQLNLLLQMTEGAPLKVQALLENDIITLRQTVYQGLMDLSHAKTHPVALAAEWEKWPLSLLLELLGQWLNDLIWFKLSNGQARLIHADYAGFFAQVALPLKQLIGLLDTLQTRSTAISHLQNINRTLLLEELLIQWASHHVLG